MGRQPKTGQKIGPPVKQIDWDVLDNMLKHQCTSNEIAGHFGIHLHTLYDKVRERFGQTWTEYSISKQSSGLGLLRVSQFQKAVNTHSKGNVQMLIWLGKQYLKQKDGAGTELTVEDVDKMDAFVSMIREKQTEKTQSEEESSSLNNEDNNTSSE